MKNNWVEGGGMSPSPLMVVGEAPAVQEVKKGKCFVGKTGLELNNLLWKVMRIFRDDIYATNFSKCMLNDKKEMDEDEIAMFGEILEDEIKEVRPYVILALGAVASHHFIKDHDMEAINAVPFERDDGIIVVPCFHPAATFRDTTLMAWVMEAFKIANDILEGKDVEMWEPPNPTHIRPIQDLEYGEYLVLDTETVGPNLDIPYMVTASSKIGDAHYTFADDADGMRFLNQVASSPSITILLHNSLFDLPVLEKAGIRPRRYIDTMVMAFLLQTLPLGLKPLAFKLCSMEMKTYEGILDGLPDLSWVPKSEVIPYACQDADATLRVFHKMKALAYPRMMEVLERDMGIIPMVLAMMKNGIKMDVGYIDNFGDELEYRNIKRLLEMEKWTGPEFNPGSAPQITKLLHTKLGLGKRKRIKKTKWGKSTDVDSLKKIESEHPVVKRIMEWKEAQTLLTKYVRKLPGFVEEDGRIHTNISLVRTKHSGRLASSKPNLMAQPIRTEEGREIRNGFVARDGWRLVSADYSQIEMRVMAHISECIAMRQVFLDGRDIHTNTAMTTFGIKEEEVDEMKHRYPSKRAGFGILNWISPFGLSRELMTGGAGFWTEGQCKDLIDGWFDTYPGAHEFMERTKSEAMRYGKVVDMWGRMEYIPEVYSVNPYTREIGLRRAGNQPIQSGAGGVIKQAMWDLRPRLEDWKDVVSSILQIHDDLLFEIREDAISVVVPVIVSVMENAAELSIPLKVDTKMGIRWGSMKGG